MYYPVCVMVQIKDPLLLIGKSNPCSGGSGFPRRNSVRSWCDGSSDRSFMLDLLSYFSFQPMLHNWCYPVSGMMHIKEPLLLIGKSSQCGGSWFSFSLSRYT